nr:Tol-Pal system beta propeller repeat protein TolB [Massilia sp. TS11]
MLRWSAAAAFALSLPAAAQMRIEISGVGSTQIPIAIATFADENLAPQEVSAIIRADLTRSGYFKVVDAGQVINETASIDYAAWKARGVDAIAVGSVQKLADGRIVVRYKLLDTIKGTDVSSRNDAVSAPYTRAAAHRVADDIYEKLTGVRGAFSTRISYVTEGLVNGVRKQMLMVADADGENATPALRSAEPIISPAWSPDGTKLAYASMESRKPVIYVQELTTGRKWVVANEKGNNSGPAWSPDGKTLAVSLSRDGHYQVYLVNADGSGLRRLTNGSGIDTEGRFSPDGQTVYFASDRSGGAQIYKMPVSGGPAQRVTFNGPFNFSPRISPDGKTLAYVGQRDGSYNLYVMDLASGQETKLADNATEPSFSPNGRYIMYATGSGRKTLAVVSVDGRVKQSLSMQAASIKEPSWGPFLQ